MKTNGLFWLLVISIMFSSCYGTSLEKITSCKKIEISLLDLKKENDSLKNVVHILNDSISHLYKDIELDFEANLLLSDSISFLNTEIQKLKAKPIMTADNFISLYKYHRLEKYYRICKRNPSQWKFYKGWSIRVFENE
jgi:cell division protein FtsB